MNVEDLLNRKCSKKGSKENILLISMISNGLALHCLDFVRDDDVCICYTNFYKP